MGELEPVRRAASPAIVDDALRQLIAAWLLGFPSEHTRRSYSGDLTAWLTFCDEHGVEPLRARRPHIDAWARSLEELKLKPRTIARRLSSVSSWYDFLVTEQVCATSGRTYGGRRSPIEARRPGSRATSCDV